MFLCSYFLPLPLIKKNDKMHGNCAGPTHRCRIIFSNMFCPFPGHKPTLIFSWGSTYTWGKATILVHSKVTIFSNLDFFSNKGEWTSKSHIKYLLFYHFHRETWKNVRNIQTLIKKIPQRGFLPILDMLLCSEFCSSGVKIVFIPFFSQSKCPTTRL